MFHKHNFWRLENDWKSISGQHVKVELCGLCWLQSLHLESESRVWGVWDTELLKAPVLREPRPQHSEPFLPMRICSPLYGKARLKYLPFHPWKCSSWRKIQGQSAQVTLLRLFAQDDVVCTEARSAHSALRSHSHCGYDLCNKCKVAWDVYQALGKRGVVNEACLALPGESIHTEAGQAIAGTYTNMQWDILSHECMGETQGKGRDKIVAHRGQGKARVGELTTRGRGTEIYEGS